MNLTLHHFKKEFRYLRLAWLIWLLLLVTDLAVALEWILPLSADTSTSSFWSRMPSLLLWVGAAWLTLGYSKEDARADDRSFITLRPLPERCFWSSRFLVFTLLVLLPLMAQEALYLHLSGRPLAETLEGMTGRAFLAGAALFWLLPMPLLAAGWARFGLAGAALLTGVLVKAVCEISLQRMNIHSWVAYDGDSLAQAAWVGAAGLVALAAWQRGRGWSLQTKGIALAMLTTACYGLLWTPWLQPWSWRPRQPETALQIEDRYPVLPEPLKITLTPITDLGGERKFLPQIWLPPLETPRSWIPAWRVISLASDTAKPDPLPWQSEGTFRFHGWTLPSQNAFAPYLGLPDGTLSRMTSQESARSLQLGLWGLPESLERPVDLSGRLEATWFQVSTPQAFRLEVGAKVQTSDLHVQVLEIQSHTDWQGLPSPGSLTVTFKLAGRQSFLTTPQTPIQVFLHDAESKLLWQGNGHSGGATRALDRGWFRYVSRLTFSEVLTRGSGLTESHLPRLEGLAFQLRHAGKSRHRLELKDLKLGRDFLSTQGYLPASNPRVASHPRQGFHDEFKRLRKPAVNAPREEVARYLAHVLTLAETLRGRGRLGLDKKPLHPGNDLALADELAPWVLAHPDLLTTSLPRPYGHGRDENMLLREILEAALLSQAPDRFKRRDDGLWWTTEEGASETRLPMDALLSGRLPWKENVPLVEQALREKRLEPLLELHRRWRELERREYSDAEILANLKSNPSPAWLLRLRERGEVAEQGRHLVRQTFAQLVPPATDFLDAHRNLTETALFAGSEAALHLALCRVRLWEPQTDSDQRVQLSLLSVLSRAMGGKPVTAESWRPFRESLREHQSDHYAYDPASMTWRLKPQP